MSNTLGNYNPKIFANVGLDWLKKSLGMANTVYRGYDPRPGQKGSVIELRRPSTFTAQDAPSSAQDLYTDSPSITIDQHKEVKMSLVESDFAFTQQQIIDEHVGPMAYELARQVDYDLCLLYKDVPWSSGTAGTPPSAVSDITAAYQVLFDNEVPMNEPSRLFGMINGQAQANFTGLSAFAQWTGSADMGVATQMTGRLGHRYGLNWFANQNVQTHTKGTCSTTTLAVNGAVARGVGTVSLDAGSVTGTLVAGDVIKFAGHSQKYSVTATATASGNAFASVSITPTLRAAVADNEVVTATLHNGVRNLVYHSNAFCLAMRPLPDYSEFGGLGAETFTATDPVTKLALRASIYLLPDTSKINLKLDVLYGVKTLNPNMASAMLG